MKKKTLSQLKKRLWELTRQKALRIYPYRCYTCGKPVEGSNRHLGHMWAKAILSNHLKYDLRVLRWQCMACNVWYGGRGADFYAKMLQEIGEEKMKALEEERKITVKADRFWFEQKIKELEDED